MIGDSEKNQVKCQFTDKYVYLLNMGGVLVLSLAIIMRMVTSNCQFVNTFQGDGPVIFDLLT